MKGGLGQQKRVRRLQIKEGCPFSVGGWEVLGLEGNA